MKFSSSERQVYTITLGVLVLIAGGSMMALLGYRATESVPFSKKAWNDRADWGDRWPIAKRFTETGSLRGKSEAEVKQLLDFNSKLGDHEDKDYDAQGRKTIAFTACGRYRFGRLLIYLKNGHVLREELQEM
ncbi:hypothetical protein KBI23_09525 [bacterium]|nr:hypothetical protein [bacterium]MBP9810412.1 hypothetical protein [bacterium]